MKQRNVASISSDCVACGCCIKVCPLQAVSIPNGIRAYVNTSKCVGCGKCALACPAQIITILPKEVPYVKAESMV